jgi:NADH-quinone oxidoreductase subunit N
MIAIDVAGAVAGWQTLLPALVVLVTALVVMCADLLRPDAEHEGLVALGIGGLVVAAVTAAVLWAGGTITGFHGMLRADGYGLFFAMLTCLGAILTLLMSVEYLRDEPVAAGDYCVLVLLAASGMVVMAAAADLLAIFLALEIMSVAVYVLAGMRRGDLRSNEAAVKYFLLGAFASGFLLYGVAFVYGATGSTRLDVLAAHLASGDAWSGYLLVGSALLLVGFGFKVALMPFHVWTPDVYEGAPTPITTFMAVGVKAAGFAAFARVFAVVLAHTDVWPPVLAWVAVLTMTVGNVTALAQTSTKRMLAYSSIAHAGYALIGVVVGTTQGTSALLFYLVAYTVMNVGAFGVLLAMARRGESGEQLSDLAGVGLRHPGLGLAMTVFMLSLAGMPPTAGFIGKVYLFTAAVDAGWVALAIAGVLNSLVSVYYYLGVLVRMFMTDGERALVPPLGRPVLMVSIGIAVVGTLGLGFFPGLPLELARLSAATLP